ncbi:MAG: GDSL-type esterase/lipase family protein [Bacteroidales bacterium]
MSKKDICIIVGFVLLPFLSKGQFAHDYQNQYPFLNTDTNEIIMNHSGAITTFFHQLDSLIIRGDRQLNIFHLGDSHIQADFLTHRLRDQFQSIALGQNAGRGFVFPYRMAKTNNPLNYRIHYEGEWEPCRNVERDKYCHRGLGGMMVSTQDSLAEFSITFNQENRHHYAFNQVRVFHEFDTSLYRLKVKEPSVIYTTQHFPQYGYTRYLFDTLLRQISFQLILKEEIQDENHPYQLFGFSLDNDDPGIVYHSSGVNGADTKAWLRCDYLQKHLSAINPDLIILSLGTNDVYTSKFNNQAFKFQYRQLLEQLKTAAPNAAFILTSPGDHYRYRRYLNNNTSQATTIIADIAKNQQMAFWNFYEVMGSLNSIKYWKKANLAAKDYLHFNQQGYLIQADLFFNAFMKTYSIYMDQQKQGLISDSKPLN